jgi:C-methyltransferase
MDLVNLHAGRVSSSSSTDARYALNDVYCTMWLGLALTALVNRKVPDCIGDAPEHYNDVAARAGLHAPSLYRVLRAAAANNFFTEVRPGIFEHNEKSRLLRSDHPHTWRGMARMWGHPAALRAWEKFGDVLVDGQSGMLHAFGQPLYEVLHADADAGAAFTEAMVSNSSQAAKAIARALDPGAARSIMDLGGGVGSLLAAILDAYPQLHGTVLEIADLEQPALDFLSARGLRDRAQVVVGDFLESVPAGADVYLVKNSLWNWDDARALSIMENVRRAIGDRTDARFVIVEYVINDDNARWTTLYDLQILTLPGGRARTVPEYEDLLGRAGFRLDSMRQAEDQSLLTAIPC